MLRAVAKQPWEASEDALPGAMGATGTSAEENQAGVTEEHRPRVPRVRRERRNEANLMRGTK